MDATWSREETLPDHLEKVQSMLSGSVDARPRAPRPRPPSGLIDITNFEDNKGVSKQTPGGLTTPRGILPNQSSKVADLDSIEMLNSELKRMLRADGRSVDETLLDNNNILANHQDQTFQDVCNRINVIAEMESSTNSDKMKASVDDEHLLKFFRGGSAIDSDHLLSRKQNNFDNNVQVVDYDSRNQQHQEEKKARDNCQTLNEDQFKHFMMQIDRALTLETDMDEYKTTLRLTDSKSKSLIDKENTQSVATIRPFSSKESKRSDETPQNLKSIPTRKELHPIQLARQPVHQQGKTFYIENVIKKPEPVSVQPSGLSSVQTESHSQQVRTIESPLNSIKLQKPLRLPESSKIESPNGQSQENQAVTLGHHNENSQVHEVVRKPRLKPEESFNQSTDRSKIKPQTTDNAACAKGEVIIRELTLIQAQPDLQPVKPSPIEKPVLRKNIESPINLSPIIPDKTDSIRRPNRSQNRNVEETAKVIEQSDNKVLSQEQQVEFYSHLADMKTAELKGKLVYIVKTRIKDCGVFIKLIVDTLQDFVNDRSFQIFKQTNRAICDNVENLVSKSKEKAKLLKSSSLVADLKFQELMLQSIVSDVSELIQSLSQHTSGWSSNKPSSVKEFNTNKNIKAPVSNYHSVPLSKDKVRPTKEDELNLFVKKSEEAIRPRKENLSAKIDFVKEEAYLSNETNRLKAREIATSEARSISTEKHMKIHEQKDQRNDRLERVERQNNDKVAQKVNEAHALRKPEPTLYQKILDAPPERIERRREPMDRSTGAQSNQYMERDRLRDQNNPPRRYGEHAAANSASEIKEGELIQSQKFGCRIFCMKMIQKSLVCGFEDGSLSVFAVNKLEGLSLERSNKLHATPICSIACTPVQHKRQLLFTGYKGSSQASIIVWDFMTLRPLKELCGHIGTISCLEYILPNYLISASFDRKVIFWDLNECEAVLSIEVHNAPILSSYYDHETKCLYTGSLDSAIVVAGLVIEEGELMDCKILKTIQASGPVLHLSSYMQDILLSFQNSKIVMYDARGIIFRELRTNTLPNCIECITDDRAVFVDVHGKPFTLNLTDYINSKKALEFPTADRIAIEKSAVLMGMRLNGAYCRAQFTVMDQNSNAPTTLVITANEKNDSLYFYRIK